MWLPPYLRKPCGHPAVNELTLPQSLDRTLSGERAGGGRAREGLAGVAAVALMLATGRWGSYLGVPGMPIPIFLTDILIGLAFIHATAGRLILGSRKTAEPYRGIGVLPVLLLVWVALRFAIDFRPTQVALRDLVPYAYIVLAFLAARSFAVSSQGNRERTVRILEFALKFHLAWVTVALVIPSLVARLPDMSGPTGTVSIFGTRPDFDAAVLGVLAAVYMRELFRDRRVGHPVVGFLACWSCILALGSRGGLLAALLCNLVAFAAVLKSQHVHLQRKALTLTVIPLVVAGVLAVLPLTEAGQRLLTTFDQSASTSSYDTTQARMDSWRQLWDYSVRDEERFLIGVGFGPHFMVESGALALLTGTGINDIDTRSPHNYLIGSLLRLGLVGACLIIALLVRIGMAIVRNLDRLPDDTLPFLAAMIAVAMVPAALVGVILESPFGAVPFFWSVGLLLNWSHRSGRDGLAD